MRLTELALCRMWMEHKATTADVLEALKDLKVGCRCCRCRLLRVAPPITSVVIGTRV